MTRQEAKTIVDMFQAEATAANLLRGFVTGMAYQVNKEMADRCRQVLKMAGAPRHVPEFYQCLMPLYNLAYGLSHSSASPKAPLKSAAMRAGKRSTSKK